MKRTRSPDMSAASVPLPLVMERVAGEVGDLSGLAEALQSVVGRLTMLADPEDRDLMTTAQSFDLLTQRLGSLAGFLDHLPGLVPDACRIDVADATRAMPLASLKDRLCHDLRRPEPTYELELF